jgi:hypothetical protein
MEESLQMVNETASNCSLGREVVSLAIQQVLEQKCIFQFSRKWAHFSKFQEIFFSRKFSQKFM